MKRVLFLIFIWGVLIVCSPLVWSSTEKDLMISAGVMGLDERKKAPDFSLKDLEGVRVRLKDYRGKVVLINFWGTW